VHRLQLLLQAGSESRSVGLDLSRRPPSAGQAPLAVLRGSLGIAHVQLSCVTDVGLVCVVERCDLTELKEILLLFLVFIIIIIINLLTYLLTYLLLTNNSRNFRSNHEVLHDYAADPGRLSLCFILFSCSICMYFLHSLLNKLIEKK